LSDSRFIRRAVLAVACGLVALSCWQTSVAADAPPNIVLILLDDADVRDFALYEPERPLALPAIEALAARGVVFDQFYASSPVCSPTRASILTGQYPARYGLNAVVQRESPRGLPERAPMLAAYLRDRGYATAHIGKWHLGTQREAFLPRAKGFDHAVTSGDWNGYYGTTLFVDGVAEEAAPDQHLTARLTDHALRIIQQHQSDPFFLNLWYFTPHVPLQPPDEWREKHPNSTTGHYAALMGHLDQQIGRIVAELEALGLADRTAILLASDNGGTRRARGNPALALRGHKKDVHEGGIRSPLVVHWPGRSEPGSRNRSVAVTMDLFPTLVDLLGDDPAAYDFDGASFAATLSGEPRARSRMLFWQVEGSSSEVVSARDAPGYLSLFAVRDGDRKLVMDGRTLSLFDLASDPGEQHDIAAEHPNHVSHMLAAYDAWRLRTTRIPMALAALSGPVEHRDEEFRFDGPARVVFEQDVLHEVADGDLSCHFRLRPEETGREQRIVGKRGAWTLVLSATDQLELRLGDGSGGTSSWRGQRTIASGEWHDVAISLFGLKTSRLSRVFVDGTVEIQARHEHEIASSNAPITLGAESAQSFDGTVSSFECFALGLTRNDLSSTAADQSFEAMRVVPSSAQLSAKNAVSSAPVGASTRPTSLVISSK
jgi:arylsulfatase A-like enzyme